MKKYFFSLLIVIIVIYILIAYLLLIYKKEIADEIKPVATEIKTDTNEKKLYLIIDDFGYYSKYTDDYLNLEINYTVAILPKRPNSDEFYNKAIYKNNLAVIIHQPMEAQNNFDSGKASLKTNMTDKEIIAILNESYSQFPLAVGMNNHTGSLFTEDYESMKTVIKWIISNGLIFIDSRTTNNSAVKKVCEDLNIPFYENQIFLDVYDEKEFINNQFDRLKKMVLTNGYAVAIGHVQTQNLLPILKERIYEFQNAGISFVNVKNFNF